jgi:hypothetical protein
VHCWLLQSNVCPISAHIFLQNIFHVSCMPKCTKEETCFLSDIQNKCYSFVEIITMFCSMVPFWPDHHLQAQHSTCKIFPNFFFFTCIFIDILVPHKLAPSHIPWHIHNASDHNAWILYTPKIKVFSGTYDMLSSPEKCVENYPVS